jgi:hypothetical protein
MTYGRKEQTVYMREWRSRPGNQAKQNKSALASFVRARDSAQAWVNGYKLEKGCMVCGFRESPFALDLHHRDPKEKSFVIASMLGKLTLEKIKEEVTKCDVLCSNHHRMRHHDAGIV